MPITYNATPTSYFMPEERDEALAAMLATLNSAAERFRGFFFNFSHPALVAAVADTWTRHLDTKIILDHVQAGTPGGVRALHALFLAGYPAAQVRIGTSPIGHNFQHLKSAVTDGLQVLTGSTNWSNSGFLEENDLHIVVNADLAASYEAKFDTLWDWITQTEPSYNNLPAGAVKAA